MRKRKTHFAVIFTHEEIQAANKVSNHKFHARGFDIYHLLQGAGLLTVGLTRFGLPEFFAGRDSGVNKEGLEEAIKLWKLHHHEFSAVKMPYCYSEVFGNDEGSLKRKHFIVFHQGYEYSGLSLDDLRYVCVSINEEHLPKNLKGPVPRNPTDQKIAGHHWLREIDFDGRPDQPVILQWGPFSKAWFRSGEVGTGLPLDTRGFEYLAPVEPLKL